MKSLKHWITIHKLVALVILGVATTLIFNCTRKETKEVRFGVILPLTGEAALMGELASRGLRLAEEYINARGGISGKQVHIIIEDGMAIPQQSLGAFRKLVDAHGIRIILSLISPVDLSLIPMAIKSNVLFISHATHPTISGIHQIVFRHSPIVQQEVDLFISFLPDSVVNVTLAYMNDDYGVAFKNYFECEMEKISKYVFSVVFQQGETDFRSVANKIIHANSHFILIAGTGRNLGQLIWNLRELGYKGRTFVSLGFVVSGAVKSAGEAITGVYGLGLDLDKSQEVYSELESLHRTKYDEEMHFVSVLFFNTVLMLQSAIEDVGEEPQDIAQYLRDLGEFLGIGEVMTITTDNDITPPLKIITF